MEGGFEDVVNTLTGGPIQLAAPRHRISQWALGVPQRDLKWLFLWREPNDHQALTLCLETIIKGSINEHVGSINIREGCCTMMTLMMMKQMPDISLQSDDGSSLCLLTPAQHIRFEPAA